MKLNEARKLVDDFDRRDIVKYKKAVVLVVKADKDDEAKTLVVKTDEVKKVE